VLEIMKLNEKEGKVEVLLETELFYEYKDTEG
jgi:hypothetical protein